MSSFRSYPYFYANRVRQHPLSSTAPAGCLRLEILEVATASHRAELQGQLDVDACAVPSLASLALQWAVDCGELDRVLRNLPIESQEALALAWRNFESDEKDRAMADQADVLAKEVQP